jgi:diaminohydroxyphosphoribosylaminopyrimidine deaminase / 5-amino-6-(5-phosphoribosylamino)uracil reductase
MTDGEWMDAAVALGVRARGTTAPNPNVGCVIVRGGTMVGQGATQPGGRPHAEAVALAVAGERAHGATVFVTLEPCAHDSNRGPACADLLVQAGVARVVAAMIDPDPRTSGRGLARLRDAGIAAESGPGAQAAASSLAGYLSRLQRGRPYVTLKLAMSLDGKIAMPSGESRWITGEEARADVHRERARADMVLVGRGTYDSDAPKLDVRLPGLEEQSPRRALLTRGAAPHGWTSVSEPEAIRDLHDVNDLLIEGGAGAAAAFLAADLVDRLIIYRAPILIGEGQSAVGAIGLDSLAEAHGRWIPVESAMLGIDRRDVYERRRN